MAGNTNGVGRPDLDAFRADPMGKNLTTNQGIPIADNQNWLRDGERGPSLLEDFIAREKITHFDHERIPERVVHARGAGAHGTFQAYESMAKYTRAHFLSDPSLKTPVFVRFSTVGGSRGSADTVRDVRGFAVKFYTQQGNYDIVGNNIPVFFIQDAIKFPDFVHAVKPEPRDEIPQASSAHDTFWDFVSLTTESAHMVMWLMSDRAIPRSYRTMEGFGIHTFRLINAQGQSTYVKWHWKPILGTHSLVWDETQKIAGKDPDFNRRDLWEAIEKGDFPEWELGVQLFDDAMADTFDFDILDPTKLIPEELVPVQRIGKMTLNKNPDSYFAETEQIAFCTANMVPGIDVSNDPLLQGRHFSYLDTQLTRLGGPNFHQIPINRPVCPFSNGQRDGMHQMQIDTGMTSYDPNSLDSGFPKEVPVEHGGFETFAQPSEGVKRRVRASSFADHFSQATMFWNSMSPVEKEHIASAFSFELAKVKSPAIRERALNTLIANIDTTLAGLVAEKIGLPAPHAPARNGHADGKQTITSSPALSQLNQPQSPKGRKIAILAAGGVDGASVTALQSALMGEGVDALVLGPHLGELKSGNGAKGVPVDHTLVTMPSVVFDAVAVAGGAQSVKTLLADGDAVHFIAEAYKHCKAVAAIGDGAQLLAAAGINRGGEGNGALAGVVTGADASEVARGFVAAIAEHRAWTRTNKEAIPA